MRFTRHILLLTLSTMPLQGCHPPFEPEGLAAGLYSAGATGVGNPGSGEQEAVVFDGVSHVPVGDARIAAGDFAALGLGLMVELRGGGDVRANAKGGFRADLQGHRCRSTF